MTSALLTTGHTRADEEKTLGLELLGAADGIRVVRVTAIDDNVSRLEVRDELLDELVDGRTGLHEEDDLARALELLAELLNRPGTDNVGACMETEERSR